MFAPAQKEYPRQYSRIPVLAVGKDAGSVVMVETVVAQSYNLRSLPELEMMAMLPPYTRTSVVASYPRVAFSVCTPVVTLTS